MFFSKGNQNEIAALKAQLYPLEQVWEGLYKEMVVINVLYDGRISHANDNFLDALGYNEDNLTNNQLSDFIAEHSRLSPAYTELEKALQEEGHWSGAIEFVREDGNKEWLRIVVHPVVGEQNQLLYFSVFGTVLTKTIATSREQKDTIKAIYRSMAVIEFDLEGHVLTANDQFLSAMGYNESEIIGQHHRVFCETEEANSAEYQAFWSKARPIYCR